ncbi:F0F1 ATP synthase subunit A [Desulfofustis glycolicus]|uniref:ATP synthase subunit a n=1 Tax=Desulfofustis glycolicus DSM 9705 TaxID=1121409 RepID=A0A1M5SJ23_9BACT|nr:F0F1 ATP synthase subunit A [Desulfofustis glycolicus]MCB2215778.1 F0F1 ATP synthase subunit A [Desulfobulbaceae bacterium]SHH38587.1 ATP synthase F0 subcomplex A subunit [Desulfofustis glycolicus DSM 9705]
MDIKDISPDQVLYWQWEWLNLNATIVFTWLVMVLLVLASILITRRLSAGLRMNHWQNFLEIIVNQMSRQIEEIVHQDAAPYLPFIGTLFLFIVVSNTLAVVPGFIAPTASLSTTAGLALAVFIAVPLFGIREQGLRAYIGLYLSPTPFMLPFNILGELSRTLALAVRLFGNIMSGTKIVLILLSIAPLFVPVLMHALGLLTGLIQAYIFAILAAVYISSATRARREKEEQFKQGASHG